MNNADSPGGASQAGKVYDYLRDAIIEGDLPPGTRLLERELSERLGVSRIPVRDALPRLEAEGLIVAGPRRGSVVASMTLRDVDELFDVRTSLETLAARLAARRAAEGGADPAADPEAAAHIDRLAAGLARAEVATAAGDPGEIASANSALHEALIALAGSRMLAAMMSPINARVRWLFRLTSDRDPHVLCHEHRELCDAVLGGHVELAAGLALVHVERGRAPSLRSLAGQLPDLSEVSA